MADTTKGLTPAQVASSREYAKAQGLKPADVRKQWQTGGVPSQYATPAPATAATPSMPTDIWGWAQEQTNLGQKLLKSQEKQQQSLFGQYTAASKAQEPLQAAYGRLGAEAGVPELEKTIGGFKGNIADVQNRLNQLEGNINERIKGQDVSEAQRQRIIGYEATPLTKQLGELGTAMAPYTEQLSGAQQKIATQIGLVSADQQKALQPMIMQIDSISDRFAREITMYNSQKETTLTAIMDKLTRDRQLADQEWQQAQQLASEEREWARVKEQIAMEQANKIKLLGVEAGYKTPAQPSQWEVQAEAQSRLTNDIVNYMNSGGNMDPNSGGKSFFNQLYSKYSQVFDPVQIKQFATAVYGS